MAFAKSVLGWAICLACLCAALIACVLTLAPEISGVSHGQRDLYIPVTLMVTAALFNPIAFRHVASVSAFLARLSKAVCVIAIVGAITYAGGMARAVYPTFVAERVQQREIAIARRADAGEFANLDAQEAAARRMRNRLTLNDAAIVRSAIGVQQSDAAHKRAWFLQAAQTAKHPWKFAIGLAPYAIAQAHEYGIGVKPDSLTAAKWFARAATLDILQAHFHLGRLAETAPRPDYAAAVAHYRLAADRGSADAQFALARLYDGAETPGRSRSPHLAARYYFMSASQGHAWAQNNLATCYQTGDGVTRDEAISAYWYRQAAEQGDGLAAFELASAYATGRGVAKSLPDYRKWMRKYYLTHNEATPAGL